jgi:hypothetical protein
MPVNVHIFRLQEKINRVKGPFFWIVIFSSYGGMTPYGYSIFRSQLDNMRYPLDNKEWETRTEILYNADIIYNATSCFITSSNIRTLPELHRVMHTRLDNPSIYMPHESPEISPWNATHKSCTTGVHHWNRLHKITRRCASPVVWYKHITLRASRYTSTINTNILALNYGNNFMYHYLSPDRLFFLSL